MPEYINLNPVIREISDVQNNILLLNGKMDTMGAQVGAVTQDLNTTRQKLQELAEAFEKFSRQAERISKANSTGFMGTTRSSAAPAWACSRLSTWETSPMMWWRRCLKSS